MYMAHIVLMMLLCRRWVIKGRQILPEVMQQRKRWVVEWQSGNHTSLMCNYSNDDYIDRANAWSPTTENGYLRAHVRRMVDIA